jgi:hypothetical protein
MMHGETWGKVVRLTSEAFPIEVQLEVVGHVDCAVRFCSCRIKGILKLDFVDPDLRVCTNKVGETTGICRMEMSSPRMSGV